MTINAGVGEIEAFAMANCRNMILSSQIAAGKTTVNDDKIGRKFRCKTCGRDFSSFQALGGHRASHNKTTKSPFSGEFSDGISSSPAKSKNHICSLCGLEFPIGQALGGHMRRHRSMIVPSTVSGSTITVENSDSNDNGDDRSERKRRSKSENDVVGVQVSSKRICLDLNLSLCSWNDNDREIEVREIVHEQDREEKEEEWDFLKLELRQPIN